MAIFKILMNHEDDTIQLVRITKHASTHTFFFSSIQSRNEKKSHSRCLRFNIYMNFIRFEDAVLSISYLFDVTLWH